MKTRNGAYQRLKLLSAPLSLDENTEQYLPKNAISAHSLRAYIFSNIRSVPLCYGQVWFIMSTGPAEFFIMSMEFDKNISKKLIKKIALEIFIR